MINLKSKLLVTLTVVLIASIVLSSYAAIASAKPKDNSPSQKQYDSFTLTASGTAKNAADEEVIVSIAIQGQANGKLKTVFHLRTQPAATQP